MKKNRVQIAVYQEPKTGNDCCGDSYFYVETEDAFLCAIADGLGSGTYAKESAEIVIETIKNNVHISVEQLVKKCTEQLYGKRGAVLGIFKIEFDKQQYSFSSIGNIGMIAILKDRSIKRAIPNAGYLSCGRKDVKVMREKLEEKMNFIIFSDGITDSDLATKFYYHQNVNNVVQSFTLQNNKTRYDDTTLIAIHSNSDIPSPSPR